MNPSRLFIFRPVATILMMIAVMLAGLLSYRTLSISALPEVDYPVIQVSTQFPGASADVMATGVTAPLERQLGQMSGLNQMYSVSSGGASVITLKFNLDVTLDIAEQEVQAAINAADSLLPRDLPYKPTYKKVNPADTPILTLAATSDSLALTEVQDIINTRVALRLSQISGVGLVSLAGGQQTAVRIRVDPTVLASYGLTLANINSTIASQNVNGSKGGFDGPLRSITISANDQLQTAEEYANLVLKYVDGKAIYLRDVATIEEAPQNEYQEARANGTPAIIINIQRQPGTNVVSIADEIKAKLPQIQADLPGSVDIKILADRTQTIRAAIHDVELELILAISLVVAVTYAFLRTLSATFIAGLAVPISVVGSFGIMYLAGFSLNNLTLMALTIATGFVIDDAIVVVENIQRHIENGKKPFEAALLGSKEISFTIISLTVSLVAVLIPLLFMGDIIGRLFREFSITLAVAILVSMFVSLTLTPMLCAYLLKATHTEDEPKFAQALEKGFDRVIALYDKSLQWVLKHQPATLAVAILSLVMTGLLYLWVPHGFFPTQDTGQIQGITKADSNVSFGEMMRRQNILAELIEADPAVESVTSIVGVDAVNNMSLNTGRLQIVLKPFEERDDAQTVIARLKQVAPSAPGIEFFAISAQDLNVDDMVTPGTYQMTLNSTEVDDLETSTLRLVEALRESPLFRAVEHNLIADAKVAYAEIHRDVAARYGLSASDIATALYNSYGQRLVSTIYTQANQYRVVLEVAPKFKEDLSAIDSLYLKGSGGVMVPMSEVVTLTEKRGYALHARLDQTSAITVSFNLAEGVSIDQAKRAIDELVQTLNLPDSVTLKAQGSLLAYESSSTNTLWLILAAVVTMYIVLGILYESWIHPITVLSTLPSAAIGALLALKFSGTEFTLIALIGIILLIGIVKKNAIMLIDFALQEQRSGSDAHTSIYRACLLRFRPILMTTFAALLGAVPLMLASGSGAELRQPLGLVIIGGLLLSQLITLYTTPVIYLYFERLVGKKPTSSQDA